MPEKTETSATPSAAATPATGAVTRLSVNINEDTAAKLRWQKEHKGISITETIRRAVALLDLVERETAEGSEVLLKSRDGKSVRQLWLV
ncbi:hypothetical protein AQJ43_36760 [Streptomyces avermitilis]|uniref:Ribbon-helix-helix protein CopG domain-containing protein n=2 Tax=Streptomyces avermitilis TaxID=33903 RepID=A0A143SZI1_STRAW|nr:hypothetical protein [Streptomyces avermitilis]KUN48323.1 hypothetical protein AQJ43_36760 [Streptomyces avermitilis]BAU77585.1 hypothetical protein SAVERM_2p142 [Streptomyces avermitilis MA-4680 = NBRC 14893]GDY70252.1 hypothetical protein SAV14893_096450 [Streptomyces avermitilis]GDY80560.1 hypothetical protein SAV31267_100450 [Streptomyces avermitilis]